MCSNVKKYYANLSKIQQIGQYRKKNAAIRHEYYTLSSRHSSMEKAMFTFTVKGKGTYTKLRLINEVKTYITYLIANSKADIYFFSNIEIGHSFTNPHIHTQLWHNDFEAIQSIYDKVIKKFKLDAKRCQLSTPQHDNLNTYHYVIKDYATTLTDEQVWKLEQTKKKYRKQLGLKIRFYSKSKSKYSKKAYRYFYRTFGILRGVADKFMDWFFSIFFKKERFFKSSISSFITIKNKGESFYVNCWDFPNSSFDLEILFYAPSNDPPFC